MPPRRFVAAITEDGEVGVSWTMTMHQTGQKETYYELGVFMQGDRHLWAQGHVSRPSVTGHPGISTYLLTAAKQHEYTYTGKLIPGPDTLSSEDVVFTIKGLPDI